MQKGGLTLINALPSWNSQGVLPPVDPSNPVSSSRSPYAAGIIDGFQWLDGSFLENIESLESRPPRDIDVVTFYNLPLNQTQRTLLQSEIATLEELIRQTPEDCVIDRKSLEDRKEEVEA